MDQVRFGADLFYGELLRHTQVGFVKYFYTRSEINIRFVRQSYSAKIG